MESSTPIEIITKRPEQEIRTIPELAAHLMSREIPSINALARFNYKEHLGWQKIVPLPEQETLVKHITAAPRTTEAAIDSKFTGAGLCIYSSLALIEAMKTLAPFLKTELTNIQANTHRELGVQAEKVTPHTVVVVTDRDENKTVIDTAFKQVQHDGPMIKSTPLSELPLRYHIKKIHPTVFPEEVTSAHRKFLDQAHFNKVVASLL